MASTVKTDISAHVIELSASILKASAGEVTLARLTGDASTRSYFRLQADGRSLVAALYDKPFDETESATSRLSRFEAENPAARLSFANDPCAYIEVTKLLIGSGLPIPPTLATSGGDAVLLIEDVGDIKLQDWLVDKSDIEIKDAYACAIELIVRIQESTERVGTDSICSRLAFDEMKLKWELGFFFANYFNRFLGLKLDARTANGVQEDFKAICSELAARPRVLTHRDYHARNLMMHEDRMFIIDHQDARMGPTSYDLASLVYDPYTELDPLIAREIIERFIEMKSASSVPIGDEDQFRHELELMTVQRMLKAVGTYSYQAAVAGNISYLPYIEPAINRALKAMSALGRFQNTRALLEKSGPHASGI